VRASGVARVFVGQLDPNPKVRGGGVRRLRRAGLDVRVGVLEEECRAQHRGFVSTVTRGRPFVTLKLAATLDGRIATAAGASRWITGPAARAHVHRLRARSDAVMVGSGTARADDPTLTARRDGRVVHRPVRVLLDSGLRVPTTARLYAEDAARTWVLCSRGAPASRRRDVAARGARLLPMRPRGGRIPLDAALARLGAEGLGTLLVEGGGDLAAALLRAGLVDELVWFVAPRLLGADARPAIGPLAVRELDAAPAFAIERVARLGPDLLVEARAGGAR
jgi:diaminohydroxyphosphoribosylaminopyrimidine deaminase/5-amino-6-(5-phosphoribosylamino)uracil reductase